MKIGQIIKLSIGECRIMRVLPLGTYDVEHITTGNWYRITGYSSRFS
jgi:hypothetical protein